ncbi:hypothetical protein [Gaetbulibacter sp. NE]|uniref:hypothetical protein n=1 Tax=Gaetbulibacter sp. NE TaxID=2982307 RepID=UPI0021CE3CB7|nr:hypothetical protein [Gaetbulibacter sp. NE]
MNKFCTILFVLIAFSTQAQDIATVPDYTQNVKSLDSIVTTLYKVISGEKEEERNWDLFKYLFKPEAKLIASTKPKDSIYRVRYMSPQDYIKSSAKWLVENGFIEKEIHRKTETFGNITHVFSTYEAYHSKLDSKPFMRGINSIQLLYDGKRWWIINLYWAKETAKNPIPSMYLPD